MSSKFKRKKIFCSKKTIKHQRTLSERFSDLCKEKVAIFLYKIGKKPCATMFIDEVTVMYGYGKCHSVGMFEYNLPSKYVKRNS